MSDYVNMSGEKEEGGKRNNNFLMEPITFFNFDIGIRDYNIDPRRTFPEFCLRNSTLEMSSIIHYIKQKK
jgi:hypothetical protein